MSSTSALLVNLVGYWRTLVSRAIALPGYLPPRLWIRKLALRFMKRRAKIVHRNLELCFPEMSEQERRKMVVKNFESVGMGLMETGMAWFWPDRRIARWTEVIGMEHIRDVQAQKRGILLVGIHFLTLELGARQFGMQEPGIGVYRPNDNPLIDWLQTWGRLRSNKSSSTAKI